MAKTRTVSQFVCPSCGYESVSWYGKCPNCGSWEGLKEFKIHPPTGGSKFKNAVSGWVGNPERERPVKLSGVKSTAGGRVLTGLGEFDRVLGGGFVPGSVVLLAGEPGVGKSTLLLELVKRLTGKKIFYLSGEESVEQIKTRADRLGLASESLLMLTQTNLDQIAPTVDQGDFLIVDSVQTVWSTDFDGFPGSVTQVKGCTQILIGIAKKTDISIILIGHVTKEGEIAGPMMLTHMVDVVLFMEGERYQDLRLLRSQKNRYGSTDEVGVWQLTDRGITEVKNPSELALGEGSGGAGGPGSVATVALEGSRPLLVEIQALVTKSFLAMPRRVGIGIDNNRLNLLTAVLQKVLNLPLYNQDIFVKVAGGFRVVEPAADLAICLAIISSFKNVSIAPKTAFFGEVGLLGEIRRVSSETKREKEAVRLGFQPVIFGQKAGNLRQLGQWWRASLK